MHKGESQWLNRSEVPGAHQELYKAFLEVPQKDWIHSLPKQVGTNIPLTWSNTSSDLRFCTKKKSTSVLSEPICTPHRISFNIYKTGSWALLQRQQERAALQYFMTRHGWKIHKEPERTIWVTSPLPFRKLFQMLHPSVTECSYSFLETENHLK